MTTRLSGLSTLLRRRFEALEERVGFGEGPLPHEVKLYEAVVNLLR